MNHSPGSTGTARYRQGRPGVSTCPYIFSRNTLNNPAAHTSPPPSPPSLHDNFSMTSFHIYFTRCRDPSPSRGPPRHRRGGRLKPNPCNLLSCNPQHRTVTISFSAWQKHRRLHMPPRRRSTKAATLGVQMIPFPKCPMWIEEMTTLHCDWGNEEQARIPLGTPRGSALRIHCSRGDSGGTIAASIRHQTLQREQSQRRGQRPGQRS